jgi:hypothetical protein
MTDIKTSIGDMSIAELEDSSVKKIALELYGEDATISEEQLVDILELDLAFGIGEITVSAGETRQFRQFEPNNYHATIKFSLENVQAKVVDKVRNAPAGTKLDVYQSQKQLLYKIIQLKLNRNERFLRNFLQEQEKLDGIER